MKKTFNEFIKDFKTKHGKNALLECRKKMKEVAFYNGTRSIQYSYWEDIERHLEKK